MKWVPRLPAEPPLLATYRATHPSNPAAGGPAVWRLFRDDPAYREVRQRLVACQQGLCGYCEQRLTDHLGVLRPLDQQLEHVLPKSAQLGRALDWTNLMLCCGGGTHANASKQVPAADNHSCGQWKGDRSLPSGCDPRYFPCIPRLVDVGMDGSLSANAAACASVGIASESLNRAIDEVLNLNCERLRVARQNIVRQITKFVLYWEAALVEAAPEEQASLRDSLVQGRLGPDASRQLCAFWTTVRQYLEPWSSIWIQANQEPLGCVGAAE